MLSRKKTPSTVELSYWCNVAVDAVCASDCEVTLRKSWGRLLTSMVILATQITTIWFISVSSTIVCTIHDQGWEKV